MPAKIKMKSITELMSNAYTNYLLDASNNEEQMDKMSKIELIRIIKLLKKNKKKL
tara:strand:- start:140 stop:304 length:165 start_codon:yes stop_codon:yes gene_type:complete